MSHFLDSKVQSLDGQKEDFLHSRPLNMYLRGGIMGV